MGRDPRREGGMWAGVKLLGWVKAGKLTDEATAAIESAAAEVSAKYQ